jgi:hypothetical protein
VKTPKQQAQLMQHRVRALLIRQRTQAINALRSHLAELVIVAPQGFDALKTLIADKQRCPPARERAPAYQCSFPRAPRSRRKSWRSRSAFALSIADAMTQAPRDHSWHWLHRRERHVVDPCMGGFCQGNWSDLLESPVSS